jgi:hypothetical protein
LFAVFADADAVVVAALVASISTNMASWWNARKAARQGIPNGGSSMKDSLNRIESVLATEVVPRLDHGAIVHAEHADRLAVLEADRKKDHTQRHGA